MGPDGSGRVARAPPYSGTASAEDTRARKGVSPAPPRLSSRFRLGVLGIIRPPYYPRRASTRRVWAVSSSLAATGDIDRFLSSPAGTKMFQFPASAPGQKPGRAGSSCAGCPIRTLADRFSLADPREFSQLAASFIASGSQGILRSLLFASQVNAPTHTRRGSLSLSFELLPVKSQSAFRL